MYYIFVQPTTTASQNQTLISTHTTTQVPVNALSTNSVLPTLPSASQVLQNYPPIPTMIPAVMQPNLQTVFSSQNAMGFSIIHVRSGQIATDAQNLMNDQNVLQIQNSPNVQTVFDNSGTENTNSEAPAAFPLQPVAPESCPKPILTQTARKPTILKKVTNKSSIKKSASGDLAPSNTNAVAERTEAPKTNKSRPLCTIESVSGSTQSATPVKKVSSFHKVRLVGFSPGKASTAESNRTILRLTRILPKSENAPADKAVIKTIAPSSHAIKDGQAAFNTIEINKGKIVEKEISPNLCESKPVCSNSQRVKVIAIASGSAATTNINSPSTFKLITSSPSAAKPKTTSAVAIPMTTCSADVEAASCSSSAIPMASSPTTKKLETIRIIKKISPPLSSPTIKPPTANLVVETPQTPDSTDKKSLLEMALTKPAILPKTMIRPKATNSVLEKKPAMRKRKNPGAPLQDSKDIFYQELNSFYESAKKNKSPKRQWSQNRINEVIKLIEAFKEAPQLKLPRTSSQYHYAHKYDVIMEDTKKVLIQKEKGEGEPAVRVVPSEEYFDVILATHLSTHHGGRDKMLQAFKTEYLIPTSAVNIFLKHCKVCQSKRARNCDVFESRGIVYLIDMLNSPAGQFKYILQYKEYVSKFSLLRPLISNDIDEIALEMLKIFLEIGCPRILETSLGHEATAMIIKKLLMTRPDCKLIQGKPQVEQNRENCADRHFITYWLNKWMDDNHTRNWSIGIYFIQFRLNSTRNPSTNETPFMAFLGKGTQSTKYFKYSTLGPNDDPDDSELNKATTEEELETMLTETTNRNKFNVRRQDAAQNRVTETVSVSDIIETVNKQHDSTKSDSKNEDSDNEEDNDEIQIKLEEHTLHNTSSDNVNETFDLCTKDASSENVSETEDFRIKDEIKEEEEEISDIKIENQEVQRKPIHMRLVFED